MMGYYIPSVKMFATKDNVFEQICDIISKEMNLSIYKIIGTSLGINIGMIEIPTWKEFVQIEKILYANDISHTTITPKKEDTPNPHTR